MSIRTKIERYIKNSYQRIIIKELIKKYKNTPKILYLLTPEHKNLGDHAIAIANEKIIKEKYKEYLFLEFSYRTCKKSSQLLKNLINDEDIIVIPGGGNLVDFYEEYGKIREEIIANYLKNKIIIMPQSITFDEGEKLEKIKKIYMNHSKLYILARDIKSYEQGKKYFNTNNIFLAPDSAFYLEKVKSNINKREGIKMLLRNDIEKKLSNDRVEEIIKIIKKEKVKFEKLDTLLTYDINKEQREYEVIKFLNEISKAKLIITDRFHGVIFSVLTGTPVIAFKSKDHKIEEGIKWFVDLEWVHYNPNIDEISKLIKKYINEELDIKVDNKLKELKEILERVFFSI